MRRRAGHTVESRGHKRAKADSLHIQETDETGLAGPRDWDSLTEAEEAALRPDRSVGRGR